MSQLSRLLGFEEEARSAVAARAAEQALAAKRTEAETKAMERHTVYAAAMGAGRNTLRNTRPATRLTIFS